MRHTSRDGGFAEASPPRDGRKRSPGPGGGASSTGTAASKRMMGKQQRPSDAGGSTGGGARGPGPQVPFHNTMVTAQKRLMTQAVRQERALLERDHLHSTKKEHVGRHLGTITTSPTGHGGARAEGEHATPFEIRARGPKAHLAFLEALKHGTHSVSK